MLLTELLTPERVRIPLGALDKVGVLRELVELVVASGGGGGEVADVLLSGSLMRQNDLGGLPDPVGPLSAAIRRAASTGRLPPVSCSSGG